MSIIVLDIDLDFFLDDIRYSKSSKRRLKEKKYHPWSEDEVREFLEEKCGLSQTKKIPGRIVEDHDGAFLFWRELIEKEELKIPFEVIHVDAHADLGLGDNSWKYIMGEILHQPVERRWYPKENARSSLNPANYLAFAIACRWISRLTFVIHPLWRYDLVTYYFKDYYVPTGQLQFKIYDKKRLNRKYKKKFYETTPDALEPLIVPLDRIRLWKFKNQKPISLIILSQSPGFTPKSADVLIPVIQEYIEEI